MNRRKHLSTLGLRPNNYGNSPPPEEIHKAWKRMALKCHPDKVPEDEKEEAKERFQEITEAYTALMKRDDLLNFRMDDLDDIDTIIMEALNSEDENIEELTNVLLSKMTDFLQNTFTDLVGNIINIDFGNDQHFVSFIQNNVGAASLTEIEEDIEVERNKAEEGYDKPTEYRLEFNFTEAYNQEEKEIEFDGFQTMVKWSSEGQIIFPSKGALTPSGKARRDLVVKTELNSFGTPPRLDTESAFPDLILKHEVPLERLITHNALIEVPFLNKKLKITRKIKGRENIRLYGEALRYTFKGMGMPITTKNGKTQRGKLILELLPVFKNEA